MLRFGAAADPEEAIKVNTDGCGRLGVKRVRHVDPGADASDTRQTRDERKGERGAAGAFRAGEFGDGSDGKSAVERVIEGRDAGGGGGSDNARGRRESRGDAAGESGFDLLAEVGGGGHAGILSPYLRLLDESQQGGICTAAKRLAEKRLVKERLAIDRLAVKRLANGGSFPKRERTVTSG